MVKLLSTLKLMVVLSASMGSALPVGSLAVAAPQQEYFVGDVVTFKIPGLPAGRQAPDELLTHRVVGVSSVNGINPEALRRDIGGYRASSVNDNSVYRTQGDANNVVDDWELVHDDIVGKVIFHLPYLGYLLRLPQIVLAWVF